MQFQVATNLVHQTPLTETNLAILPWIGGWFFLLLALGRFLTRFFYPFFMHLSVIMRLFRVDPNKGQPPRDPMAADTMTPKELLKAAQKKIKDRRPIAYTTQEAVWEILKLVFVKLCCCGHSTAFGRSIA